MGVALSWGCHALLIMPRPLSGCQIKAEIKGFLLRYRLFQYQHWFFHNLEVSMILVLSDAPCNTVHPGFICWPLLLIIYCVNKQILSKGEREKIISSLSPGPKLWRNMLHLQEWRGYNKCKPQSMSLTSPTLNQFFSRLIQKPPTLPGSTGIST